MCRQYSAETEDALKRAMRWEGDPIPGARENAERIVLDSLTHDPYQLEIVRRAIRYYLDHADGTTLVMEDAAPLRQGTH